MNLADQSGQVFHATLHSGCLALPVASMPPTPVRIQKGTAEVKGEELSLVILRKTPWEEAAESHLPVEVPSSPGRHLRHN